MRMKFEFVAVAMVLACLAGAEETQAQSVDSAFVDRREFKRPTFDAGDEQLVRDFAKGMGQEFNQDMELPSCKFRTRLASSGGFADGWRHDGSGVLARIPFSQYEYTGLVPVQKPEKHYSDYPREPFLEFRGKGDGVTLEWTPYLVLPPMVAKGFPLGPPFRAVHVRWEGKSVATGPLLVMPGMPVRIELAGLQDVWSEGGAFEAVVANLATESDSGAIRVTIAQRLPALGRDVDLMERVFSGMIERDNRKQCAVFARDCRDGECGP